MAQLIWSFLMVFAWGADRKSAPESLLRFEFLKGIEFEGTF